MCDSAVREDFLEEEGHVSLPVHPWGLENGKRNSEKRTLEGPEVLGCCVLTIPVFVLDILISKDSLFSLLKKDKKDYVYEKQTEGGILPVQPHS